MKQSITWARLAVALAITATAGAACTHSGERVEGQTLDPANSAIAIAAEIRQGSETPSGQLQRSMQLIGERDEGETGINAILSLNPQAETQAVELDAEARAGRWRGALHGIPVLIKDNIETRDLPTTGGTAALADNNTGRDAALVEALRNSGALILGKTNLSELANYMSENAPAGWGTVGGQTRNAHAEGRSACGSSSGSAAAVAAGYTAIAIGTETNGSIICPASVNGVVGFKPTVGLVSQFGIIPLSSQQDTAGPITQTVRDAALVMDIIADPQANGAVSGGYLTALATPPTPMRIGVFRWAEGSDPEVSEHFNNAVQVFASLGYELVDIPEFSPDPVMWFEGDNILRSRFLADMNAYLENSPANIPVRSMAELVAFNDALEREGSLPYGQRILRETLEAIDASSPQHLEVAQAVRRAASENGIDALLELHNVDVLILPASAPAGYLDPEHVYPEGRQFIGPTWLPAMAGYPMLTVPMGQADGLPIGLAFTASAGQDRDLLALGFAFEQAMAEAPRD